MSVLCDCTLGLAGFLRGAPAAVSNGLFECLLCGNALVDFASQKHASAHRSKHVDTSTHGSSAV
jgi:hypothetical protein